MVDRAHVEGLPEPFAGWFGARGWRLRDHQRALIAQAEIRRSTLLIAPTGAGKTLAGFLPTLIALNERKGQGLHTLYVSPLKALAVDIQRNLALPAEEMKLGISIETRTGDTPAARRQRQRRNPPDILLTTPEQLALMLSHREANTTFAGLKHIVLDELHALVSSKRGDLLALGLSRLRRFTPGAVVTGLSATVALPSELRGFIEPQPEPDRISHLAHIVVAPPGARPEIQVLQSESRLPWAGHSARYALPEIYTAIAGHKLTLVFVNTRSQAEMLFHDLWRMNDGNLSIALHHGSLDVAQRRKVEAAMAAGRLRGVVCTSTLDLGVDWGDVDLVINVGAPKGASRLAQRIGRANHRLDEPSRALLIPANNFEVMECRAALDAASEGAQDTPPIRDGGLDVLAQHVLGMACAEPFEADDLYTEVRSSIPYRALERSAFDRIIHFVATGGYALKSYERFAKLRQTPEGKWRVSHPRVAQIYRLNAGVIVEAPMIKVRLGRRGASARALAGGRVLGEVEEWFIEQLSPGDTFAFAGDVLRFEGLRDLQAIVSRSNADNPSIPSYEGGKFPLSTYLAARVRKIVSEPAQWRRLPDQVRDWLEVQRFASLIPKPDEMLAETFPRGRKHYLVAYPFEGRLAHQTLGMLLTRRLERIRAHPLGFVANEYALAIWGLSDMGQMIRSGRLDLDALFDEDMLGDDLDAWLAESSLMKRSFRLCAIIAGLIERRHPGQEKTGRQLTVSTDLIYDVLRSHEPSHILLKAARADAATGLLDVSRVSEFLARVRGRIRHSGLRRVSPLAVPVMLEIGREAIYGEARDEILREEAAILVAEAMGEDAAA